ncbi:MAG TPA: NAD(P)-dependent oxidoreductase [Chitinophagaceae bacterium]|nr:NAD(P)-dependent oxidoreductase [Chitinophagaceae bacterium]
MFRIGLIREGKIPHDNRVAMTPRQCQEIEKRYKDVRFLVQPSPFRCYSDQEYAHAGITLNEDLQGCAVLLGIKEVPIPDLIPDSIYFIFSHTKKQQRENRQLLQSIIAKRITLVDYECLVHSDGQRILGFGFFAGVVGTHNGLRTFGIKSGSFNLPPVYLARDFHELILGYFGLKLPNIKIALTGSGRVAAGCIEVMNLLGIKNIEPEEFIGHRFDYPVFTQLKGSSLYGRKSGGGYDREEFHLQGGLYYCKFEKYLQDTDILVNGIYWEKSMPPLFRITDLQRMNFRIKVIADITCDQEGSVPCNLGATSIEDPVYGVDRISLERIPPYLPDSVDMMTVGNLPNELPRDASQYFGEQLIKYVLPELLIPSSRMIEQATIVFQGKLTPFFAYLHDYSGG